MPIKLPKGFPRRKSSGNVLEFPTPEKETNGEQSSFKVLARPNSTGKSFEGANALRLAPKSQPPPRSSFEEDSEDLFSVIREDAANRYGHKMAPITTSPTDKYSGSGGTTNSLSTAAYDSAASSARYSNSSTNPSSVDSGSSRNVKAAAQRSYDDIPPPPPPTHASRAGFLKNAGRTFSFGINKNSSKETNEIPPPMPTDRSRRTTVTEQPRERAMTMNSVVTVDPPRLDDSSFSLKSSDDDFGNMFANVGKRASREVSCNQSQKHGDPRTNQANPFQNPLPQRPAPLKSAARAAPPRPIHVNGNTSVESSPYTWNSHNSRDGLLGTPSPARTVTQASPQPPTTRMISHQTHRPEEENMFADAPLRRSPEPAPSRQYSSPAASRSPPSAFPALVMNRSRTESVGASSIQHSNLDSSEYEMPPFDTALLANVQLAERYEEQTAQLQHNNPAKVMTPAEFERYRQQKEDTRRYNKVFGKADSDDGSGDDYDDEEDDEQEREKTAAKQRKKQEAHLAVYRQQMMKVTGESSPNTEQRPDLDRRMSQLTVEGARQASYASMGKLPVDDEPEEDEDVPLGILAAHGFPNKNKPPTRLAGSTSNPNLRNLAQIQGGASVAGGESHRGSLPAFARHLPPDPYFGAGIVHQADRTAMQMHPSMSQTQLVSQPQPSGAATAHPLHPAGLVGVIAGEERARAMRRGSPNPQGGYEAPMPQGMRPQQMPNFPQQGMMMQPPMLTPSEQAQLQMSQQMNQMMQMQMQWMQQMSGMMAQNPHMQMPQMPMMGMQGMPQMPQNGPMTPGAGVPGRPQSVPLQNMDARGQRTMSTLTPSMAGWMQSAPVVPQLNIPGSNYAQSIAPSERSNVGLSARYRPVSTMPQEPDQRSNWKRASTFSSSTFRPTFNENLTPKPAISTVRTVYNANDDDDDEQGWAEMKARKDKKQKTWKLRKGANNRDTLQELYNAPA